MGAGADREGAGRTRRLTPMPTRLLTVKQVAALKKGNGPRARWHVTEKALEAFIARCGR